MLYGGPLGTYLSGLSSSSTSPSSSGTTHGISHASPMSNSTSPYSYNSSNYLSNGVRRSNSRYRTHTTTSGPSLGAPTSSYSSSGVSSAYHTPQLRRKYGSSETESSSTNRLSGSGRYVGRSLSRTSPTSASSTTGVPGGHTSASSGITKSNSFHYSRWPQNKSTVGPSLSWNSDLNAASESNVDYKRLYESEKLATIELRQEISVVEKDKRGLQSQIEQALQFNQVNNDVDQRRMERRLSECQEELKVLENMREESEKLRAEHRALVRVVSRLYREQ